MQSSNISQNISDDFKDGLFIHHFSYLKADDKKFEKKIGSSCHLYSMLQVLDWHQFNPQKKNSEIDYPESSLQGTKFLDEEKSTLDHDTATRKLEVSFDEQLNEYSNNHVTIPYISEKIKELKLIEKHFFHLLGFQELEKKPDILYDMSSKDSPGLIEFAEKIKENLLKHGPLIICGNMEIPSLNKAAHLGYLEFKSEDGRFHDLIAVDDETYNQQVNRHTVTLIGVKIKPSQLTQLYYIDPNYTNVILQISLRDIFAHWSTTYYFPCHRMEKKHHSSLEMENADTTHAHCLHRKENENIQFVTEEEMEEMEEIKEITDSHYVIDKKYLPDKIKSNYKNAASFCFIEKIPYGSNKPFLVGNGSDNLTWVLKSASLADRSYYTNKLDTINEKEIEQEKMRRKEEIEDDDDYDVDYFEYECRELVRNKYEIETLGNQDYEYFFVCHREMLCLKLAYLFFPDCVPPATFFYSVDIRDNKENDDIFDLDKCEVPSNHIYIGTQFIKEYRDWKDIFKDNKIDGYLINENGYVVAENGLLMEIKGLGQCALMTTVFDILDMHGGNWGLKNCGTHYQAVMIDPCYALNFEKKENWITKINTIADLMKNKFSYNLPIPPELYNASYIQKEILDGLSLLKAKNEDFSTDKLIKEYIGEFELFYEDIRQYYFQRFNLLYDKLNYLNKSVALLEKEHSNKRPHSFLSTIGSKVDPIEPGLENKKFNNKSL